MPAPDWTGKRMPSSLRWPRARALRCCKPAEFGARFLSSDDDRRRSTYLAGSCGSALAGGPGFEPGLLGPEPRVLPLNYPPKTARRGIGRRLGPVKQPARSAARRPRAHLNLGPICTPVSPRSAAACSRVAMVRPSAGGRLLGTICDLDAADANPSGSLRQQQAAVDHDDAAGHVARRVGGEQQERAVEVGRRPEAALRDLVA
jgi:hypothetical protein